jgi:hypothetical protein
MDLRPVLVPVRKVIERIDPAEVIARLISCARADNVTNHESESIYVWMTCNLEKVFPPGDRDLAASRHAKMKQPLAASIPNSAAELRDQLRKWDAFGFLFDSPAAPKVLVNRDKRTFKMLGFEGVAVREPLKLSPNILPNDDGLQSAVYVSLWLAEDSRGEGAGTLQELMPSVYSFLSSEMGDSILEFWEV